MVKALLAGVSAAALLAGPAAAAPPRPEAPAWVVSPAADSCRTELELTGASGTVVQAALVSDGEAVQLVYAKADAPERAFLPIRVDQRPYPNLVLRQGGGGTAAMQLSAETLAALKKGRTLQIGWLADEPVATPLAGSEQALADLRTCGAQAARQYRDQLAARRDAQARAEAEARAKALADEQLAAARAQTEAAEAEARRNAAETERLQAQAAAERRRAEAEDDDRDAQPAAYPYARAYGYDPRAAYAPPAAYPPYGAPSPYRGW